MPELAEELTDDAARGVRPERGLPRAPHLDERCRDDGDEQIARDASGRGGALLAAKERDPEEDQLERQRPRHDSDQRHEAARANLADGSNPVRPWRCGCREPGARRVSPVRAQRERDEDRERPEDESRDLVLLPVRRGAPAEDGRCPRVGGQRAGRQTQGLGRVPGGISSRGYVHRRAIPQLAEVPQIAM